MSKKALITGITGQDGSYLAEHDLLVGDSSKARAKLGWTPSHSFDELIKEMVESDLEAESAVSVHPVLAPGI